MIESLRNSESKHLALFAVCTFGIGFFVGLAVRLFSPERTPIASTNSQAAIELGYSFLAMNAARASYRVAIISIFLWLLSFMVLAGAFLGESRGGEHRLVHHLARTLYILSFIAVVAAVSSAVFFMMCYE